MGLLRPALIMFGWLAVALGVAGIFLPLLPTTPFMLLAAACFARSSERFHHWLLAHPIFGTPIRQWHESRTIPSHSKRLALAAVVVSFSLSIVMVHPRWYLQLSLVVLGIGVATFLARIPATDNRP